MFARVVMAVDSFAANPYAIPVKLFANGSERAKQFVGLFLPELSHWVRNHLDDVTRARLLAEGDFQYLTRIFQQPRTTSQQTLVLDG